MLYLTYGKNSNKTVTTFVYAMYMYIVNSELSFG